MADFKAMRSACSEARGGRIEARAKGHSHSSHPHGAGRKHRATGGRVGFADGGNVEGPAPKSRSDRHGKKGGAKININVISPPAATAAPPIAAHPPMPVPMPGGAPGGMPPRPPMAGGPPGAGMPPPGGGAPMMRPPGMKRGGAAKNTSDDFGDDGDPPRGKKPPQMKAGAASGEGRLEKAGMEVA